MLYINRNLNCVAINSLNNHDFEDSIWCNAFIDQNSSVLIGLPNCATENDQQLVSFYNVQSQSCKMYT